MKGPGGTSREARGLRGFQRVHLRPGETTTVTFTLTPDDLSIYDDRMQRVVG